MADDGCIFCLKLWHSPSQPSEVARFFDGTTDGAGPNDDSTLVYDGSRVYGETQPITSVTG
ncbi:MAG: hypothetical protein HRT54_22720 [Colwellia sp.]|nr:hypothetical protein [Colwellia sp.]